MFGNGERGKRSEAKRSPPQHDEFLELCAISTTGELSEEEQKKLGEHLGTCSECRRVLTEFEAAACVGAPLVAAEIAASGPTAESFPLADVPESSRSSEQANPLTRKAEGRTSQKVFPYPQTNGYRGAAVSWNNLWLPFAAAVALIIALGIYMYEIGKHRGVEVTQAMPTSVNPQAEVDALERRLSDTGHEREMFRAQLAGRDRLIRQLRQQMQTQLAELAQARHTETGIEQSLQADQRENERATQQRSALSQQLDAAETSIKKSQGELESLQQAREQDALHAGSLSDQIKDLYGQLRDREQTINQQQEMLADDRDIRDLMGARNLYIAEVYDVARDGATRKPYGRVFYTKGKSLIFYAYDLDRQPGVKKTSTFQAWGQDGATRQRALNLGVFYQDNAAQKRWVLKFDDSRELDQINAVFVTVEPRGGSQEPSGKRLLFASLRIEPNHP